MKGTPWFQVLSGCFCAVLLTAWAHTAQARSQVGDVKKVQKTATATHQTTTRDLRHHMPIFFADLLRTGPKARLAVLLDDGTELTLGENGGLRIDNFVYTPKSERTLGRLALKVLKGAFLFVGGAIETASDVRVSITTPVATVGVRGTTVWGGVIDNNYGVLSLAGTVTVSTNVGSVTLGPGEGTTILSIDQPPGAPVRWSAAKTARAIEAIRFGE